MVKKILNKKCFPLDDGIDSAVKTFYVWPLEEDYGRDPKYIYYPIYGTYSGYMDSKPLNKINVTLHDTYKYVLPFPGYWNNGIYARVQLIRNLPYPGLASDSIDPFGTFFTAYSPKALKIDCKAIGGIGGRARFPEVKGYASCIPGSKEILIKYSYKDTLTNPWKDDSFHGKKIN